MLLLVTSRACWKASSPETLVERRSAMPFALLERGRTVGYRPRIGKLDLRLTGGTGADEGRHLLGDTRDLRRVVGIGGVAGLLQGAGKGAYVVPGPQGRAVAGIAPEGGDIILQRGLRVGVGAEGAACPDHAAAIKFLRGGADRITVPGGTGLHAKEVVAARARGALGDAATPVALERGLRDDSQGMHAELLRGALCLRPEAAHELCLLGSAGRGQVAGRGGRGRRCGRRRR